MILAVCAFVGLPTAAEYRVFELNLANITTGAQWSEPSNLDPAQYVQYRGPGPVRIRYVRTWMCRGNTSGQNFCPAPAAKENLRPR